MLQNCKNCLTNYSANFSLTYDYIQVYRRGKKYCRVRGHGNGKNTTQLKMQLNDGLPSNDIPLLYF